MTYPAKVRQEGSQFYLSYPDRGTRSRKTFKTIKGAIRHASHNGGVVDMNDLPNPDAKSVAHMVKVSYGQNRKDWFTLAIEGPTLNSTFTISGYLAGFNDALKRLGFKPVRVTYNMLNREAGPIVIDEDTPSYCDVGSEAYWSM